MPPDGLVKLKDKRVPVVEQVKMGTLSVVCIILLVVVSIARSALRRTPSSQLHGLQPAHSSRLTAHCWRCTRYSYVVLRTIMCQSTALLTTW